MGLKRKRSCVEISPSSTSSFLSSASRTSTSPSPNPHPFYSGNMEVEAPMSLFNYSSWSFPTTGEPLSARLNSRTRKRVRNRSDEEKIHESTILKLFDAQRQHPDASPVLSREQPPIHHSLAQKSTLHAFWKLPPPSVNVLFATSSPSKFDAQDASRCDDCERSLPTIDGMGVDAMMIDDGGECACRNCGRRVCDMCAVSMDGRRCLSCASIMRS